jgi:hypothetical protein
VVGYLAAAYKPGNFADACRGGLMPAHEANVTGWKIGHILES